MPYSELSAQSIIKTLRTLQMRIDERFPEAGLGKVCAEVLAAAEAADARSRRLARPYYGLRILWVLAGVAVLVLVTFLGMWLTREFAPPADGAPTLFQERRGLALFEGLEPAINVFILLGAGLFMMARSEESLRRSAILKALHELRSLTHVVDMHQLTKDPTAILGGHRRTQHSPKREMTEFELTRYLDYCAEMLSLIGKISALYVRQVDDGVVIDAVNDIENLTTNLSRKIWQKIMIIGQLDEADARARALARLGGEGGGAATAERIIHEADKEAVKAVLSDETEPGGPREG